MSAGSTYEIIDGVRRAKAAQLAGHSLILARLYAHGRFIGDLLVAINDLRSPFKRTIPLRDRAERDRWQKVVDGANYSPLPYPPIEVATGGRGVTIREVTLG